MGPLLWTKMLKSENTMSYTYLVMPLFVTFIITFLLGPVVIPILRKLKAGASERDDGPASHLKKSGTPVMGGVMFLISVTLVSLFYAPKHLEIIPVIILFVGFGLVGFADDYIKVVMKRSLGLRAYQKLAGQFIITVVFIIAVKHFAGGDFTMAIPFLPGERLDLGILSIPAIFFIILGTVNGVNFTDGLDGLCGSVTSYVAVFFALAAYTMGRETYPVAMAVAGALMAYLFYNVYPAKVFMGDTGSLALGGFVAGMAVVSGLELFIPICGLIYFLEVLSVIIQVSYFKMTHGKRIFKMAPLHHHFELSGWEETRVVMAFSIVTVLVCIIAFLGM